MARKTIESANAPAKPPGNTANPPEGLQSFASVQAHEQTQVAVEPQNARGPGRPSEFDQAIFDEIIERISDGETLKAICEGDPDIMPSRGTFRRWCVKDPQLWAIFSRAREEQQHAWADEIVQIADDGRNDTMTVERGGEVVDVKDRDYIERSKLRVETRLRLMAKLLPKVYGEKIEQTINGNMTTKFTLSVGDGSVQQRQEKPANKVTFDLPAKSADEIIEENL